MVDFLKSLLVGDSTKKTDEGKKQNVTYAKFRTIKSTLTEEMEFNDIKEIPEDVISLLCYEYAMDGKTPINYRNLFLTDKEVNIESQDIYKLLNSDRVSGLKEMGFNRVAVMPNRLIIGMKPKDNLAGEKLLALQDKTRNKNIKKENGNER